MAKPGVLRNRNFAILFSGQIVSKLGNNLYLLALPWYVYSTTGSKGAVAVTAFLQSLPIVLGLFVGVLVDRWHKRTTIIVVDIVRVAITFALFIGVLSQLHLWFIITLVLLLEAVGRFQNPATSSLIPLVVDREHIVAAEGLSQSGGAAAQMIALFGGGALMQLTGPAYMFLGNSIAFLVSVISLLFVHVDETIEVSENPSLLREWMEGLKLTLTSRRIVIMLVAAMITNFAFAAMDITTTVWIKGPVHGTAFTLGLFGGLFFSGMVIGGLLLGKVNQRFSVLNILTAGLIISGGFTMLLGLSTSLWWMLSLVFVMGSAVGLMNGALNAMLVLVVPEHMRGRIFGTLSALGAIMTPLGMAVYGWSLTLVSLPTVFILIGAPVVLSGLSLFIPTNDDTTKLSEAGAPIP